MDRERALVVFYGAAKAASCPAPRLSTGDNADWGSLRFFFLAPPQYGPAAERVIHNAAETGHLGNLDQKSIEPSPLRFPL